MTAVAFRVSGRPIAQGSKVQMRGKDGKTWMKESNDAKLRPWRRAVTAAARTAAGWKPRQASGPAVFTGPVGVVLTFAIRHPTSHVGRVSWPTAKNSGDIDKLTRAILDSLTGPIYGDDSQVVSITARKVWAEVDVDLAEGVSVWVNAIPGSPEAD